MKNVKKLLLLSVGFLAMTVTGCNNNGGKTSQEPVKEYRPIVFVMSGQSNMEGNTNFGTNASYLTKAFEDLGIVSKMVNAASMVLNQCKLVIMAMAMVN